MVSVNTMVLAAARQRTLDAEAVGELLPGGREALTGSAEPTPKYDSHRPSKRRMLRP
jgi:hypothetical protein